MSSTVRFILKDATQSLHDATEQNFAISTVESVSQYIKKLKSLTKFYLSWEPYVLTRLQDESLLFYHERQKLPLLQCDLEYFGINMPEKDSSEIELENIAALLGSLYVVEGSTLGGQIISRMLAEKFQIRAATGGSYFYSYGENIGRNWQDFCRLLDLHAANDTSAAIDAAKKTFEALNKTISAAD